MSKYTEADVRQVAAKIKRAITTSMQGPAADALLERLVTAALEGAKVPGLQTKVMELDTKVRHAEPLADEVAVLVRRKVIDSRDPAADALLDFRDPPSTPRADRMAVLETWQSDVMAAIASAVDYALKPEDAVRIIRAEVAAGDAAEQTEVDLRSEVSALKARVAELERDRDAREEQDFGLRQSLDGASKRVAIIASERDALRAQLVELVELWDSDSTLRKLAPASTPKPGQRSLLVIVEAVRLAISAPPADTAKSPMAPDCHYCGKPATRDVKVATAARVPGCIGITKWRPACDACSPPAETTPERKTLDEIIADDPVLAAEWVEETTPSNACRCGHSQGVHSGRHGACLVVPFCGCSKFRSETTPAPEHAELEAWKVAHNADCTCTRSIPGMMGPHKVGCPAGVRLGEPQAPCVKCGTAPLLPPPAPAPLCWNHDHQAE